MISRLLYQFSKHSKQNTPQPAQNLNLENSLQSFFKKYNLNAQETQKVERPNVQNVIKKSNQTGEPSQQFDLSSQTQNLKNKILSGKCRPLESNTHNISRGKQLFLERTRIETEKRRTIQQQTVYQINSGEEGVDYVLASEDYGQELVEAQEYGMRRIDEAYRKISGMSVDNPKSRVNTIAAWREHYKSFKPIRGEMVEPYPIKPYPGSPKGPWPENDPAFFYKWFVQNHPAKMVEQVENMAAAMGNNEIQEETYFVHRTPTAVYSQASQVFQQCVNKELHKNDLEGDLANSSNTWQLEVTAQRGISLLPNILPLDPEALVREITPWTHYRLMGVVKELAKVLGEISEAPDEEPSTSTGLSNNNTSLYPYYATLPDFVRNHHQVKLAYKALEFNNHMYSVREKERALNFMAYCCIEMDEVSQIISERLHQARPHHPTIADEERIIEDNEKDIIDGCIGGPAFEKFHLDRPTYPDMNPPPGQYPYPQYRKFKTELPDTTPVDYYQNDDGFWDDYIKNKIQKYANNHRPLDGKMYFKH